MRERKRDKRCGDGEEGREREKAGVTKELKERREAATDGESNTHIYCSQTVILQTTYPSVSAITGQRFPRYCTACTQSKTVPELRKREGGWRT